MIQFKVFDYLTGEQIQTVQVVNSEFYLGIVIGLICGLIFWLVAKGAA